ncbi:GTPase Era [Candidatus Ecksteinia adelgidicola]|nr:GTPase Era [Candidatus Ecksteinia adelgidicola]
MIEKKKYCGLITILGRSNVGKSTLINQLLGKKISITSHKTQTTRYPIIGINTKDIYQSIYIDTPGLQIKKKRTIDHFMNRMINSSIKDATLIIFVVESLNWTLNDQIVCNKLNVLTCPILLAINKIDNLTDKSKLLPYISFLSKKINFLEVVPFSAKEKININIINNIVQKNLPESSHYFSKNNIINCSQNFMVSEIIRESLIRFLNKELPYSLIVNVEKIILSDHGDYNIYGLIFVENVNQKKIVIGYKGEKIKMIGIISRKNIEIFLNAKVYLNLWVKEKNDSINNQNIVYNSSYLNSLNNLINFIY